MSISGSTGCEPGYSPKAAWIGLALMLAAYLSPIMAAHASSVQLQVENYSGANWAPQTFSFNISASEFAAVGTPTNLFSPTDILNPSNDPVKGKFSMYIDLTGSSVSIANDPYGGTDYSYTPADTGDDFLTEKVYDGSNQPVTVFDASKCIAFGKVDYGGPTSYWFAFTETSPTPYAQKGDTIGGYYFGSDIKTFNAGVVPTPRFLESGLALMLAIGLGRYWHRRICAA